MALVCFAADLVRWFQLLCVRGPLANAEPKTLRWQLWHTPARIVRHARQTIMRILDDRPNADTLLAAYQRIARASPERPHTPNAGDRSDSNAPQNGTVDPAPRPTAITAPLPRPPRPRPPQPDEHNTRHALPHPTP